MFCFVMHAWPAVDWDRQERLQLKCHNDELVSLTGQQLIVRIKLCGEVPWELLDCLQSLWHFEHSLPSSGGEVAEERLRLLPATALKWYYENLCEKC